MKKSDIKKLVKESVKELKEQAYGSATLTTQGQGISRAPGVWEFKTPKTFDPDTIRLVREMLEVADIHHDELVDDADTDEISSFLDSRSGGTFIKFPHFNGPQGRGAMFGKETTDQIDRSKAKAKAAALKTYTQFKTYIEDYEITDVSPAGVYGNIYLFVMFNDLAKDYTAPKGGTQSSQFEGTDEDFIRINSIGEQEQQGGEEQPKAPEVKEKEPAHSPKEIGECKAKCLNMDIENLVVQKENVQAKLRDIQRKGVDLKPSELKQQKEAKRQLQTALKDIKKQVKEIKKQQEQLMNPEDKQSTKESINKRNMRTNAKKLWDNYAKDRLSKSKSLKEHMDDHKKLARRKVLQEGVMNTFFEYFDQGHTNEEIVQLYAGKGVNVPEQFVSKARKQHEQYSKMKFELEMSEKAFKNEASQIVNNPATNEMDMLDDDKQLASGLFNEQEDKPTAPAKEKSDVAAMNDELKNINTEEEFTSILNKVLDRADSISGMSDTKVKALLMKQIKEL